MQTIFFCFNIFQCKSFLLQPLEISQNALNCCSVLILPRTVISIQIFGKYLFSVEQCFHWYLNIFRNLISSNLRCDLHRYFGHNVLMFHTGIFSDLNQIFSSSEEMNEVSMNLIKIEHAISSNIFS